MNVYAMYKGDEFICMGTIKELSEILKIKESTVRFRATPAYLKRMKKTKKQKWNFKYLIKVED